ncbi:MAG: aminoglycoside phosphotransferase family protein [bacterium]|nr:aminoglycoside phosphotransferase family protein [bacterium]
MVFKSDWEKTEAMRPFSKASVVEMVAQAFPHQALQSFQLISGGCANLNYRIHLSGQEASLVLRVYLREGQAAAREQKIGELLKGSALPVPWIHFVGDIQGTRFAFAEFMPGRSLRDLLLGQEDFNLQEIMGEVGALLAKLSDYTFPRAGFLDEDLNVVGDTGFQAHLQFTKDCLNDPVILSVLKLETIGQINQVLDQYAHLIPDGKEKHLVHGDFDPANILVDKVEGNWTVSGILDWEFAFSGSVLFDVANMVRDAHHMLPEFQTAFIEGLERGGMTLPKEWQTTVKVLNLSALLDCLKRSDIAKEPKRCADICALIEHILSEL